MKQYFIKLNLYEQIAYLMVGAVALGASELILFLFTHKFNIEVTKNYVTLFLLLYFSGHLVQALSNLFIIENKHEYTEQEKEILKEAKTQFGNDNFSDANSFQLVYINSLANDISGHVNLFNAYYSLYRGWCTIGILFTISLIILTVLDYSKVNLLSLLVSLLITFLFYRRMRRFSKYFKEKVLFTFLILSKQTNASKNI